MADIELVIKIPEELYEIIANPEKLETMYHAGRVCEAVRNGTPLPKGHWVHNNNYESYIPRDYVIALLEDKKRTRKEITNRIYECVGIQINED